MAGTVPFSRPRHYTFLTSKVHVRQVAATCNQVAATNSHFAANFCIPFWRKYLSLKAVHSRSLDSKWLQKWRAACCGSVLKCRAVCSAARLFTVLQCRAVCSAARLFTVLQCRAVCSAARLFTVLKCCSVERSVVLLDCSLC